MTLAAGNTSDEVRPLRALFLGTTLCAIIAFVGPYNNVMLRGTYMTIDFTTAAAVFLLFFVALLVNGLLRRFLPGLSFSSGDLFISYVMAAISCSICTMGLTLYLIPILPAAAYFATAENQWATIVLPFVPQWLVPQGEEVIRWYFEAIPRGQAIPWMAWVKPLLAWLPVLLGLYMVMISLPMLFRKQWIEHERLTYPLAQLPLVMGRQEPQRAVNGFFRNPVMWLGFAIPFILGSLNGLHAHYHFIPRIQLGLDSIPIFRGMEHITLSLTFPMMGFAYLVHQDVALSIWLFHLLGITIKGYLNLMGLTRSLTLDPYTQSDGGPIMAFVQFGALVALVGNTLWIARRYLRRLLGTALHPLRSSNDGEDTLTRVLLFQLLIGMTLMTGWFIAVGLPWWAAIAFVLAAAATFLGITRILCESGLAATRAQLITPTVVKTFFGTEMIGPQGVLGMLSYGQVWMSDVRTFVMAAVANGLKLTETVGRQWTVLGSMFLAVVLALVISVWTTLYYAYQSGANNAAGWFFQSGPRYTIDLAAHYLRNPTGPDVAGVGLIGLGGLVMIVLFWLRTHVLAFPIHPIGWAVSQMALTRHMWFSVFVVWLVKAVLMRYGGTRALQAARPFFLGLILGQFSACAFWLLMAYITGIGGHGLSAL